MRAVCDQSTLLELCRILIPSAKYYHLFMLHERTRDLK